MEFEIVQVKPPEPPAPQPPPAAPAAPAAEPPPAPTAEELQKQTADLYKSMGWGDPPKPVAPAAPAAAEPAAPASPPPAAPAPELPPEQEPEPEPTAAELISRAAQETASAVATAIKPPPAAAAAPEDVIELNPEDTADLETARYLERTNPSYKGATQALEQYYRDLYEYQEAWLEANPGKEFNPDDDEHKPFYEQNDPGLTRADLDQAAEDRRIDEKVEARLAPQRKKEEEATKERAFQKALPEIAKNIDRKIVAMAGVVDPALATILSEQKDAQGNPIITDAAIAKLEAHDPMVRDVLDSVVKTQLEPVLLELEKTTITDLKYQLDPKKNPVHAEIQQFVAAKEAALAKAPASARLMNGRQWMSLSEYSNRVNSILEGAGSEAQKETAVNDLNRRVWTLSADQVADLFVDFYGKKAKAIIDRQDSIAQKKYGKTRQTPPPEAAAQPTAQPQPAGAKPTSPAGGGGSDVVTTHVPGAVPQKTFTEQALDVAFSR